VALRHASNPFPARPLNADALSSIGRAGCDAAVGESETGSPVTYLVTPTTDLLSPASDGALLLERCEQSLP